MGWPITPNGIRDLCLRVASDWPEIGDLMITENGSAFPDVVQDGDVLDTERVNYLRSHVDALEEAVASGAPVSSYFYWSLLDNFEWAEGYTRRFGLAYVDYATQERILKASGHWYARFLKG